jgi:hypothetical protein
MTGFGLQPRTKKETQNMIYNLLLIPKWSGSANTDIGQWNGNLPDCEFFGRNARQRFYNGVWIFRKSNKKLKSSMCFCRRIFIQHQLKCD